MAMVILQSLVKHAAKQKINQVYYLLWASSCI